MFAATFILPEEGTTLFLIYKFLLMFIGTTPPILLQIAQMAYQNNQWSFTKRTVKNEILLQFRGFSQIQKRLAITEFLSKTYQAFII